MAEITIGPGRLHLKQYPGNATQVDFLFTDAVDLTGTLSGSVTVGATTVAATVTKTGQTVRFDLTGAQTATVQGGGSWSLLLGTSVLVTGTWTCNTAVSPTSAVSIPVSVSAGSAAVIAATPLSVGTVVTTTETPLASGTAAIGTSPRAARADHVHPTDPGIAAHVAAGDPHPQYTTAAELAAAVAALVDSSPGALDTLNELAAALGDDANFAATITAALAGKQPLDADLTAIAALTTTALGRSLLAIADGAAGRTILGAAADAETVLYTSTQTFSPPAGWVAALVEVQGVGGPGGSGRKGIAGSARFGGGGGSGGGRGEVFVTAAELAAVGNTGAWTVTIGAPGTPGAAVTTDNTDGNPGVGGGTTSVQVAGTTTRAIALGRAGQPGAGGTPTSGTGGSPGTGTWPSASGGAGSGAAGNLAGTPSGKAPGSGGGGGGVPTGNTFSPGGAGSWGLTGDGGSPPPGGSTDGSAGPDASVTVAAVYGYYGWQRLGAGGPGAGGGASSVLGNGGRGGHADAGYGGGGGGGGAAVNGVGNSGPGGNGGPAMVRITWFF